MESTPINTRKSSLRSNQKSSISIDVAEEDGVGCDSNSVESGASEAEFGTEQSDSVVLRSISTSDRRLSSFNESNNSTDDVSQILNNISNSRANFSQFETPADETRNNFGPDDFDEQLFIGQLETNCTEAHHFDEELEPQLIMETADHSESSDVDELFEDTSVNNFARQAEVKAFNEIPTNTTSNSTRRRFSISPTSHQQNRLRQQNSRSGSTSGAKRKPNRGQRHDRISAKHLTKSDLHLRKDEEEHQLHHVERLHEEDLTCDNALDKESSIDHHNHIPICLNFITSTEENLEEEQSTSRSGGTSAECLKSSPMRKRKGESAVDSPDDTLPSKKPVTEDDVDEFSGIGSILIDQTDQRLDSSEDEDGERDDIFMLRQSCSYMPNDDCIGEPSSSVSVTSGHSIRSIIPTKAHPPPKMGEWLQIFCGWSHPERLMAISELIGTCEATQVRHMMQIIEPQFQRDFISLLPKELALYVLSFLDPRDLLRAAQTCKYWRILADDNLLWREKCKEAGIGYFSAMSSRVHRRTRTNNTSHNSTANNSDVPNTRWKAAFMKQHYVEMNWKRKETRDHKVLKGHDDHVITCLQFSGNRIVSGSDDNTLKVWSANTGKCLRTLLGHTGGVWSSQMSGTTIVSGSTDRTLRVWNAETGACLHTLYGHTSTVRCMHLHEKKVVSGSRDATLRMWDVETGECLHVLVGHMAAVRCVQYNGHLVVSGAYDYMVRIWDPEREECLHQLSGHTNRVYSLQFDGIHVVSGSLDTSIRVWDVETGSCKHTLMGHQSLTSGMELRDNLLVSGNADSTVKIWDISTGQCLLTLTGPNKHLSAVTCLQLINKFVITSSDDGTVKLWDIRSGRECDFVRNLVSLSSGGSGGVVWRIRASETKLVCAVGSRNGTEETKLLVLDFDTDVVKTEPKVEVKNEIQLDY